MLTLILPFLSKFKGYIIVLVIILGLISYYEISEYSLKKTHNNIVKNLNNDIVELKTTVRLLEKTINIKEDEVRTLVDTITYQNSYVNSIKAERDATSEEYMKKLRVLESERFTHIKYLGVKSDDCNEIKNILTDIRSSGF